MLLGANDRIKQTISQKVREGVVGVDVGMLETAGEMATATVVLLLVHVDGGTAGLGRDDENEGEEGGDGGELHFWWFCWAGEPRS